MWKCSKCAREFKNTNQSHYCGEVLTVDDYIQSQDEEVQEILFRIRDTIRQAAPDAEERISYSMPALWQGENLVYFAAFKKHIGLYPGNMGFSPFEDRLAGYKRTKGGIQLPLDKPIDYELIADITRWRVFGVEGQHEAGTGRLTREVHEIPDYVRAALDESGLWERYQARPPYQRNDYIGWITRAKREDTRTKRLNQMLEELLSGDSYMGMAYRAKKD